MPTAIVSDLHLGSRASTVSSPQARERLLGELTKVDQVVLLGDVFDLRRAPARDVLDRAQPIVTAIGRALRGRRIVLVPGNHDHALVTLTGLAGGPLGLEQRVPVEPGAPWPLGALAEWLAGCRLELAYPGLWVRPGVYATHGHYLDCHLAVPRPETVLASLTQMLTRIPDPALPSHYEAALTPLYALLQARAQLPREDHPALDGPVLRLVRGAGVRGWRYLSARSADGSRTHTAATLAFGAALKVALKATSRPGAQKVDGSPAAAGRASVRAMATVVDRLGIEAEHVIFGHTHFAGPLRWPEQWVSPRGVRLTNCGSWAYEPALLDSPGPDDPYWPGTCVIVDDGPPRLRSLLGDTASSPR